MMKPKAALVKDGFLPAGAENTRGRMSGAAIERCKELAASGWKIEGFEVSKSSDATAPVTVEKVKAAESDAIAELAAYTRDESVTEARTSDGPVGMRTPCNVCGASLVACPCQFPKVWIDHEREGVVTFKSRTKPILVGKFW